MSLTLDATSLTPEQQQARETILRRVQDLNMSYTSLRGYAGTGKTYLSAQLIRDLGKDKVYACAPTHKARYVLGQRLPLKTETIHSLLGLVMKKDYDTGQRKIVKNKNAEPPTSGVVLLDESSMVGTLLWRYIEETDLQYVFVGDPAQLPPVAQGESPALNHEGYTLETIVRQESGNPILNLATAVRNGRPYLYGTDIQEGKGVAITQNRDNWLRSAYEAFAQEEADSAPATRILTYRNCMVDYYNREMRQMLHGSSNPPRFVPGDWLMMKEPHMDDDGIVVHNSEEVKVLRVSSGTLISTSGQWRIYQLTVRRRDGEAVEIPVLHESEEARYIKEVAKHRAKAQEAKKTGRRAKGHWARMFKLQDAFAQVSYCFAMTVHKSQGSTFTTAYVDHRDFDECTRDDVRQALVYVAATRPSHRLALLV